MKRWAITALLAALTSAALAPPPLAGRFSPPKWLLNADRALLVHTFGNAKPIRVDYLPYPKKIAVIFEFNHVVICRACGSPSSGSQPRGMVIRVSFDRRTHQLAGASNGWAMQFCEVGGGRPPKSACLHR